MMRLCALILICILATPLSSQAASASSDYLIRLFAGEDNTPPTTPQFISVTPIATDQIDLVWSASTDNILMGGYQVFRDAVHIATTTLTSYSDSGLTASTTYTYEVRAFDSLFNYSTTSNPVATTTLALPPEPVEATSTDSNNSRSASGIVILQDFNLKVTTDGATLDWSTNRQSRYTLRWGRTDKYDDGYVASDIYRFDHKTFISGLEPATRYEYELIGYTPAGIPQVLKKSFFVTDSLVDVDAPANVFGLTAWQEGKDVILEWTNPSDDDFANVRVVRSHLFYPYDIKNGALVYQGQGSTILDKDAFLNHDILYYTVFSLDENGNISSGAIVSITKNGMKPSINYIPYETDASGIIGGDLLQIEIPEPFGDLTPEIIEVRQEENYQTFANQISLIKNTSFVVSVPYEAVVEHLKSIIINIQPVGSYAHKSAYLLKINKDKTAYEARVEYNPAVISGLAEVAVYDYEISMVGRVTQKFIYDQEREKFEYDDVVFPDKIVSTYYKFWWLGLLLLFLGIWLLVILWRRRKEEDREDKQSK